MPGLIDRYTLGARMAPVAVVAFPLFLAVSAWIPFSHWPLKLAGGGVAVTMAAFVLGQLARDAGKAIEGPIWASWGGPPTVRMLRHRDATIVAGSKARIRKRLTELGVVNTMPSEVAEEQDPSAADRTYKTCSDWLRNKALEQGPVAVRRGTFGEHYVRLSAQPPRYQALWDGDPRARHHSYGSRLHRWATILP